MGPNQPRPEDLRQIVPNEDKCRVRVTKTVFFATGSRDHPIHALIKCVRHTDGEKK